MLSVVGANSLGSLYTIEATNPGSWQLLISQLLDLTVPMLASLGYCGANMIHAKRLSHPFITCEAQLLMVRRAGAGLELVGDSGRAPDVHSPVVQVTNATAVQAVVVCLRKKVHPNSSEV